VLIYVNISEARECGAISIVVVYPQLVLMSLIDTPVEVAYIPIWTVSKVLFCSLSAIPLIDQVGEVFHVSPGVGGRSHHDIMESRIH